MTMCEWCEKLHGTQTMYEKLRDSESLDDWCWCRINNNACSMKNLQAQRGRAEKAESRVKALEKLLIEKEKERKAAAMQYRDLMTILAAEERHRLYERSLDGDDGI